MGFSNIFIMSYANFAFQDALMLAKFRAGGFNEMPEN